jgi:four helix bundle protein
MSKADDLQARLESFADGVLVFCRTIVPSAEAGRTIDQLCGAATSVAANYRAARRARSHAEFTAKIGVVLEEADESEYWLGLALRHRYGAQGAAKKLRQEALELTKIFARSAATARSKHRK